MINRGTISLIMAATMSSSAEPEFTLLLSLSAIASVAGSWRIWEFREQGEL